MTNRPASCILKMKLSLLHGPRSIERNSNLPIQQGIFKEKIIVAAQMDLTETPMASRGVGNGRGNPPPQPTRGSPEPRPKTIWVILRAK